MASLHSDVFFGTGAAFMLLILFQRWYNRLASIENALVQSRVVIGGQIFAGVQNIPVEDDHIPFLRRGIK